jgi:hypothetical protein
VEKGHTTTVAIIAIETGVKEIITVTMEIQMCVMRIVTKTTIKENVSENRRNFQRGPNGTIGACIVIIVFDAIIPRIGFVGKNSLMLIYFA